MQVERSTVELVGEPRLLGPSWLRLPALTSGLLGVSVFWSVEMAYAPPYLLSLGMSKSHMALVFAAGPLSGLIVQPVIGVLSDACKSRWGRRRPFIAYGMLVCIAAMLLLGYSSSIASVFALEKSTAHTGLAIFFAVLAIYMVDFSLNGVTAMDRSLVVDTLPAEEQVKSTAWSTRMSAIGHSLGPYIGSIDLTRSLPWLGRSQLQAVSIIACAVFFGTHLSAVAISRERILVSTVERRKLGLASQLRELWRTGRALPHVLHRIFAIQFFNWLAWSPMFNYLTIYISELYISSTDGAANPNRTAEGTRLGTRAMFYQSLLSLACIAIMPVFVTGGSSIAVVGKTEWVLDAIGIRHVPKIHLASLWAFSHGLFALCMVATALVRSVESATFVITLSGISSAVLHWAPYGLIGEIIKRSVAESDVSNDGYQSIGSHSHAETIERTINDDERERFLAERDAELGDEASPSPSGQGRQLSTDAVNTDSHTFEEVSRSHALGQVDLSPKAGVILGIHNLFIVIPMFIMTALAAIIFAVTDSKPSDTSGTLPGSDVGKAGQHETNSVVLLFCFGGVASAIACVLTFRLAAELKHS